jgi:hypothetical protein
MEYWDHRCSIWLKNNTVHGINKPWIEKTLIQTLKLCVFDHYSMILSEPQDLRAGGQHSIIPCRRHKTSIVKSCMISIYYRNSETYNYEALNNYSLLQ